MVLQISGLPPGALLPLLQPLVVAERIPPIARGGRCACVTKTAVAPAWGMASWAIALALSPFGASA
eukprot:6235345-Alexandrium_andersonii.AAC.1